MQTRTLPDRRLPQAMRRRITAPLLAGLLAVANTVASAQTAPPSAPAGTCARIPFADANASAVTVPSAENAWGGPRPDNAATLSDRVVKYDISATLDPVKHTIHGKQALTWRNRSNQPVCAVYLHLYLNAFEGPGSTFMTEQRNLRFGFRSGVDVEDGDWGYSELKRVRQGGKPVRWSFVHPDGGPSTDRTVVRLDLPQPVAPGASTTLDIDFFNQLPRVSARTGYYGTFHLVAQWFPKIGVLELPGERGATAPRWNVHEFHLHSEFFADFGSYDVKLTVPKGYTVGATGEETGAPVERAGKVTHRYVQHDVHDFAWTADKRYAKPLEGVYTGRGSPRVQVKVLYHPEYKNNAQPALQATLDSLAFFSRTLGPYPYTTVTVVIPPFNADEAGGMEYPTFFTASSFDKVEPDTPQRYLLDFVTIHEFGHGYFYGILASNEFEEPALDEGVNEYWDQRMMRERKQDLHVSREWMRKLGIDISLKVFDTERLSAKLDDPADALGENAWNRLSSGSYGTVYSRTATMLRDLEDRVGTPAMERAFKLYYQRWKFRHPSFADFREALAEGTGRRAAVEQAFAWQVYGSQKIDDSITSFSSDEILPQPGYMQFKGKRVELTNTSIDDAVKKFRDTWDNKNPKPKEGLSAFPHRTTVVVRRKGANVPQTLKVKFADGSSRTVQVDADRSWQRFSWTTRSKAVSAQLDPERRIYMDADKLDDSRTLESNPSAARRWGSDFAALAQTLFSLLVSL
ncbi:MAG: M1 family metallopeptidase [Pseudomonadota bacterium]|nr:M1 family metallopeptidase [Pseudomonadota bacterium]